MEYNLITRLPIKDRYKIANSKKKYIVINFWGEYILSNKPDRWRYHHYNGRGFVAEINKLKNIL